LDIKLKVIRNIIKITEDYWDYWGWPVGVEKCSEHTEYNKEIKIISCDCGYIFEKYTLQKRIICSYTSVSTSDRFYHETIYMLT
jgi:hypothetical protein